MKSAYYTAVVTNAYRMAIDTYLADPEGYKFDERIMGELESVSHREYGTGFYFDDPMQNPQLVSACGYLREKAYFSTATEYHEDEAELLRAKGVAMENEDGKLYRFIQRNKVSAGEGAELICLSTNDSWFMDSRGVWMHHAQSQLRAIETGRWVVRSANTGVSSVINDRGQVLESLAPLKTGYVLEDAYLSDRVTVYSTIGNIFVYACISFCAAFILPVTCEAIMARRRRQQTGAESSSD